MVSSLRVDQQQLAGPDEREMAPARVHQEARAGVVHRQTEVVGHRLVQVVPRRPAKRTGQRNPLLGVINLGLIESCKCELVRRHDPATVAPSRVRVHTRVHGVGVTSPAGTAPLAGSSNARRAVLTGARSCSLPGRRPSDARSNGATLSAMDYREIITIEPGKRGGKPCIRGLRITVYDVLEYLASDMTRDEILTDFPDLTSEDIKACLSFAADRERRFVSVPAE